MGGLFCFNNRLNSFNNELTDLFVFAIPFFSYEGLRKDETTCSHALYKHTKLT